ncbi:MAG: M23 family metallopeptidase [Spirochaetaceae bacterium]|nr:M23 family metallopeptidase [Spirochaetaceae bacterium]
MKAKRTRYAVPAGRRRRRRLLRIALLLLAFNLVVPPYVRPVPGAVTSRYFLRTRPESANPLALEVHKGIDFRAPVGSPVRAAKSGIVDAVGTSPTLGTYVIIRHWLGFSTLYAHLESARTRAGRPVLKWARIGSAGQSGRATGPHLHFEVRWLGRRLPPGPFLAIDSARRAIWRLVGPG